MYFLYFRFGGPSSHQSSGVSTSSPRVVPGPNPVPASVPTAPTDAGGAAKQTPKTGDIAKPQMGGAIDGRTAVNCRSALLRKKSAEEFTCVGADDVDRRICQDALANKYAEAQQAAAEAASCPESLAHASAYYEALRNAALAGDVNAQRCFLAGYFEERDSGDYLSQAQRDEYLPLARQFIQSAFERGDWGLVHRLAGGYVDNPGMLIYAYPYGSGYPETSYKMNHLITLSSGDRAGSDEARHIVNALRSTGRLSAAQIQAAEEWARETYARYFPATPYNEKVARSSFCEIV